VEFGLHAHAIIGKGKSKITAAWKNGIRRFDSVINGLGGCPMTDKELVGNLATEKLLEWCAEENVETGINIKSLMEAQNYPLLEE
jgi:hydroxymethylglutaryl-CoA lyase